VVPINNDTEDRILTFKEAEEYLKIPRSTLYKLLQEGRVPARKVGRHWRFIKIELDEWLRSHPEGRTPGFTRQYCWQFMKKCDAKNKHACPKCIVYRAQALDCFQLKSDVTHQKVYCKDDCRECEYYVKYFGD
jgi:excisionase family DNA binding protein